MQLDEGNYLNMITGLGCNDISILEQEIAFDTKPLSKEFDQVLYHPVLKKISDQGATRLIIPSEIDDCDYNYEDLIEHIRTDSNEVISMIPILVYFENEERYLAEIEESDGLKIARFESIAVAFSTDPRIDEFRDKFGKKALTTYLEKDCYKEPYSLGDHDKSNLWGSLTLLKSLLCFNPNNEELTKGIFELENNLSEWTYFKKLIIEFDLNNLDQNYIVRLKSISSELNKISNEGTVLIIEDQLKDGWRIAYKLFFSLSTSFRVLFAENEIQAKALLKETNDIELILLDVRLDTDRDSFNQDEHGHQVQNLSGVKLANWIRDKAPTIPIIAATASNKSWTLEALLEQGINGYWVKGSTDIVKNLEVGIENTLDFYKKICDTLLWSQKTGRWQKELYRIADIVGSWYLKDKAKSLQALLFRSFSPFSNELSSGLQLNLAFINIYSCMNDLVEWACDIKNDENDDWTWSTINQQGNHSTIVEGKNGEWIIPDEYHQKTEKRQPDKKMAIQLLQAKLPLAVSKEFNRLSELRNGLPLIHGKRGVSGSALKSVNASVSDIDSLINLLGSLADQHIELLDKYGE
jgi:CheY-like chemotaxis protein